MVKIELAAAGVGAGLESLGELRASRALGSTGRRRRLMRCRECRESRVTHLNDVFKLLLHPNRIASRSSELRRRETRSLLTRRACLPA